MGEESPPDSARLRIRSTRTHGREDITQQVQTLEGKAAFIATGKSVPVSKQNMTVTGGVVIQQNTTEYRDVTTGFYVVPYLNGERVTLRISPHREKSASLGEGFDVQRADTTVSGYLGEWLSLGGIHQTGDETGTGLLRHRRTTGREEQQISVRVVELHR